jgi:hypothetical protein
MQWTLWPVQVSAYMVNVLYHDGWPTLRYDTDRLPPFLNPEIFIAGAQADAKRTKVISNVSGKDPYYEPAGAQYHEEDYARMLEAATQSDFGRYQTALQSYRQQLGQGGGNGNYERSHLAWPFEN